MRGILYFAYVYLLPNNSHGTLLRRRRSCRLEINLAARRDVYQRRGSRITASQRTRNCVSETGYFRFHVRRSDSFRRVTCCARVAVAAEIVLVGFVGGDLAKHRLSLKTPQRNLLAC